MSRALHPPGRVGLELDREGVVPARAHLGAVDDAGREGDLDLLAVLLAHQAAGALDRLLQRQLDRCLVDLLLDGSAPGAGAATPEQAGEDVTKVADVAEVPLDRPAVAEGVARGRAAGGAPELGDRVVVLCPLLRVADDVVGLGQLLELLLRPGVPLVGVGVVLARLLAEG